MKRKMLAWNGTALIGAVLALQSCAHTAEKNLDQKLAGESAPASAAELSQEASHAIEATPGLSDGQRAQLRALQSSTREQVASLRAESLKLRAMLIDDLVSPDYDANEVKLIEKRLRKIEDQRLSAVFGAVDRADQILGHRSAGNNRIMEEFVAPRSNWSD